MRELDPLLASRVRFVLVGTQHTGNAGSAARALKTMGFTRLTLVTPSRLPDETALAMAAGAQDILETAVIADSLAEAVNDCHLVLGTTARARRIGLEEYTPAQAMVQVRKSLGAQADGEVAIVFGRERTGLTNDELQLCNAGIMIPANPQYSSLNLAAAVQVLAYELRHQLTVDDASRVATATWQPEKAATHGQMEGFFAQMEGILDAIDFHKGREAKSALYKLRRTFLRMPMEEKELRMLRGILHDMQRALKIANDR